MPIMAETSIEAEFLKPSVLSLAFGVFFAFFVSLLLVPSLYLIGSDWANARRNAGARLEERHLLAALRPSWHIRHQSSNQW